MSNNESSVDRRQFLQSASLAAFTPYALFGEADAASRTQMDELPALKAKLLSAVPEPVIPERPRLKEMYEECWVIGYQQTHYGTPENGFVRWYIDEAFDNRLFQWDLCFALAWAKYGQGALPGMESLDNFYRKQHDDGAIAGVINESDGSDDQPKDAPWFTRNNLFSWIEYEYYKTTGDSSRFERVVPVLRDYARWVKENRRHDNGHYYWSGWSSGMDNSPRSVADEFYPPYSWVDYDANEALAAYYLAKMADVIGESGVAREFRDLHGELKQLVNSEMWSDADQFYWDLDKDGSFLKEKTVASFWPMWGRITEEKHVEGLVQHLKDEDEFNRPHRVPTLAADHPEYDPKGDYWRGSVWAPTNHMITKGLTANGRHDLARTIVVNHLHNQSKVFQETETVWENYAPESASPGEPAAPDFVGWSADGPIAQLIEHYIGIRPDVPNDRIDWMLLTDEKVGLRNLDFGGVTVHLMAEARSSTEAPVQLNVETPCAFTLRLQDSENEVDVAVMPSAQAYRVDLQSGSVQKG
jgi:hypothetical protein